MTESTKKPGRYKSTRWWILIGGLAVFIVVFLLWSYYPSYAPGWMGVESADKLTSLFGGLEALFAGLAFAGVIVAILLQMEELRQTREEMERSANALAEQAQLMARTAEITERSEIWQEINHWRGVFDQHIVKVQAVDGRGIGIGYVFSDEERTLAPHTPTDQYHIRMAREARQRVQALGKELNIDPGISLDLMRVDRRPPDFNN